MLEFNEIALGKIKSEIGIAKDRSIVKKILREIAIELYLFIHL